MIAIIDHAQGLERGDDREREERGAGLATETEGELGHVLAAEREVVLETVDEAAPGRGRTTEVDREKERDLVPEKDEDLAQGMPEGVREKGGGAVHGREDDLDQRIKSSGGGRRQEIESIEEEAILERENNKDPIQFH